MCVGRGGGRGEWERVGVIKRRGREVRGRERKKEERERGRKF